jgi:hypothetical protein
VFRMMLDVPGTSRVPSRFERVKLTPTVPRADRSAWRTESDQGYAVSMRRSGAEETAR